METGSKNISLSVRVRLARLQRDAEQKMGQSSTSDQYERGYNFQPTNDSYTTKKRAPDEFMSEYGTVSGNVAQNQTESKNSSLNVRARLARMEKDAEQKTGQSFTSDGYERGYNFLSANGGYTTKNRGLDESVSEYGIAAEMLMSNTGEINNTGDYAGNPAGEGQDEKAREDEKASVDAYMRSLVIGRMGIASYEDAEKLRALRTEYADELDNTVDETYRRKLQDRLEWINKYLMELEDAFNDLERESYAGAAEMVMSNTEENDNTEDETGRQTLQDNSIQDDSENNFGMESYEDAMKLLALYTDELDNTEDETARQNLQDKIDGIKEYSKSNFENEGLPSTRLDELTANIKEAEADKSAAWDRAVAAWDAVGNYSGLITDDAYAELVEAAKAAEDEYSALDEQLKQLKKEEKKEQKAEEKKQKENERQLENERLLSMDLEAERREIDALKDQLAALIENEPAILRTTALGAPGKSEEMKALEEEIRQREANSAKAEKMQAEKAEADRNASADAYMRPLVIDQMGIDSYEDAEKLRSLYTEYTNELDNTVDETYRQELQDRLEWINKYLGELKYKELCSVDRGEVAAYLDGLELRKRELGQRITAQWEELNNYPGLITDDAYAELMEEFQASLEEEKALYKEYEQVENYSNRVWELQYKQAGEDAIAVLDPYTLSLIDQYIHAADNSEGIYMQQGDHNYFSMEAENTRNAITAELEASGYTQEAIEQLVDYRIRQLNKAGYDEVVGLHEDVADSGWLGTIGASALSLVEYPLSALGFINIVYQKITNPDKPVDYYTPAMQYCGGRNTVKETVGRKIEENTDWTIYGENVFKLLYDTGMNIAEDAVKSLLVFYGVPFVAVFLAGSTAIETVVKAKERGATDEEAILFGSWSALAEVAVDNLPLAELLKGDSVNGIALKQGMAEYFEKLATESAIGGAKEAIERIANSIGDVLIVGFNNSEFNQKIQAYIKEGCSEEEALRKAAREWLKSFTSDIASSAFSDALLNTKPAWKGN